MNKGNQGASPRFQWRPFTSLLLAIAFLTLCFTGVILYVSPKGRIAHWTGWTMLGLEKEEWSEMHIVFGFLFLLAAGLHWFFNWDIFWSYIQARKGRRFRRVLEMALAAVVALVFLTGTLFCIPPFSTLVRGNEQMQAYWEQRSPRPPAPHAEEFLLQRFANVIGLPMEDMKEALQKEGFIVQNDHLTVRQLAEQRGKVPSDVLAPVQKHFPTAGSKPFGCTGRNRERR
ncbi:MAG: DUF4405 domain-containing protein [Pirellulales bacterium]|nr:DUF4405 domain-containing protein [Pirellulales bacterium]